MAEDVHRGFWSGGRAFSPSPLWPLLRNPAYLGSTVWNRRAGGANNRELRQAPSALQPARATLAFQLGCGPPAHPVATTKGSHSIGEPDSDTGRVLCTKDRPLERDGWNWVERPPQNDNGLRPEKVATRCAVYGGGSRI